MGLNTHPIRTPCPTPRRTTTARARALIAFVIVIVASSTAPARASEPGALTIEQPPPVPPAPDFDRLLRDLELHRRDARTVSGWAGAAAATAIVTAAGGLAIGIATCCGGDGDLRLAAAFYYALIGLGGFAVGSATSIVAGIVQARDAWQLDLVDPDGNERRRLHLLPVATVSPSGGAIALVGSF